MIRVRTDFVAQLTIEWALRTCVGALLAVNELRSFVSCVTYCYA